MGLPFPKKKNILSLTFARLFCAPFFFLDFSLSRFFSFFLSRKKIPLFIFLLNLSLFFLFKLLSSSFPEKRIYFFYNKKVFLSLEAFCILFFFSFWFVWSESLYFNFFLSFFFSLHPFYFSKKKKVFSVACHLFFFHKGFALPLFLPLSSFLIFFQKPHNLCYLLLLKKNNNNSFCVSGRKKKKKKKSEKKRGRKAGTLCGCYAFARSNKKSKKSTAKQATP